jgi:hypothetical protein
MTGHLDLDALSDAIAGGDAADAADPAHLRDCADCQGALQELRAASAASTAALAGLPPVPMPPDIAARLHEALADAAATDDDDEPTLGTLTTLPARPAAGPGRWLTAAAAALVVLAGAGYGISQLTGRQSDTASSGAARAAAPTANIVRNSSGNDYLDRTALLTAVPGLLKGDALRVAGTAGADAGAPQKAAGVKPSAAAAAAGADPLARLRTDAGLADCLVALLPPDDASVKPLAIDYGAFKGTPALVVLLPSSLPKKVDIFVVGAGCSQANDSTLFYTSADRP